MGSRRSCSGWVGERALNEVGVTASELVLSAEAHCPVGLPSQLAIDGECLLPTGSLGGDIQPGVSNAYALPVVGIVAVEEADTVGEPSNHRGLKGTVATARPVDRPVLDDPRVEKVYQSTLAAPPRSRTQCERAGNSCQSSQPAMERRRRLATDHSPARKSKSLIGRRPPVRRETRRRGTRKGPALRVRGPAAPTRTARVRTVRVPKYSRSTVAQGVLKFVGSSSSQPNSGTPAAATRHSTTFVHTQL